MASALAKLAIVRASLSTRWKARAESWSWLMAERMSDVPASSSLQCTRTSPGPLRVSALQAGWTAAAGRGFQTKVRKLGGAYSLRQRSGSGDSVSHSLRSRGMLPAAPTM